MSSTSSHPPRATIIGCGVIGLTTGIMLQKHGFQVTIRTKTTPNTAHQDPHYTSNKAGAHWFSFARTDEIQKQAQDELCFQALSGLAITEPDCGISTIRAHALYEQPPNAYHAKPWWTNIVPRWRTWTTEELERHSKESGVKYVYGFSYESIMIHVDHYLQWLYRTFISQGGQVVLGELQHVQQAWDGSVIDAPDVVVNCSGLGAKTLGGVTDTNMFPDRGQTIRIYAPEITDIWRAPGTHATYILPRGDGTVTLGGTHDNRSDTLHDSSIAASILSRCSRLCPQLRDPTKYKIVAHMVGLRPGRTEDQQRVEVDTRWSEGSVTSSFGNGQRLVLHAYGHCGDGFQSSWGTAVVALHLIMQARPMLFAQDATFHNKFSQLRTNVLERAGVKHPFAKL